MDTNRYYAEADARNATLPLEERVARFVAVHEADGYDVLVSNRGPVKRLLVLKDGSIEAEAYMQEGKVTKWI